MWAGALTALLKSLADFLLGFLAQRDAAKAHEDKARAEGEAQLNKTIAEAADAQAQVNAADRGDAAAVLGRLQHRLDPPGGA